MEGIMHAEEDSSQESSSLSRSDSFIGKIFDSAQISEDMKELSKSKGVIDTTTPINSVKSAVNKFGGIVDWKAHKVLSLEKHTYVQTELENIQEEIPKYKKQSEAALVAKDQVLEELNNTKRVLEELKLNLEKTVTEEAQAKQDSELAQLRVREMEQGISDDHSAVAKAQVEIAKARHEAAIDELKSVTAELAALQGDYQRLVDERDFAVSRAEEATSASKAVEKQVEDLTLELIAVKEAFESAHSSHLEVQERRMGMETETNQDSEDSEARLKKAKEEIEELDRQNLSIKDLESKLDIASATLLDLKTKLATCKEGSEVMTTEVHSELVSAKREIVRIGDEVSSLREVASSLKEQLEKETEAITTLRQREGPTSETLSSLKTELARLQSELELISTKEKEVIEKMEEFPKVIEQVTHEANESKSIAQLARKALQRVKEEAEEAKNNVREMEERLVLVLKEIETAKSSEELANRAVKASEVPPSDDGVTIGLEEYYKLSKSAHEAEQLSNERVINAIEAIKDAKKSEGIKLGKLEEAIKELEEKEEELKAAMEEVESANERKMAAEQELRDWRAESEQRRRASDTTASDYPSDSCWDEKGEGHKNTSEASLCMNSVSCPDLYADHMTSGDSKPRRRKQYFPRFVMFLAKKKVQSLK